MLLLERQREAVDDAAEDLEELGDAVVALGLVDEAVKCVVDLLADVGAEAEELAVDAVQDGLEEVALARVLAVEEVEQLARCGAGGQAAGQHALGGVVQRGAHHHELQHGLLARGRRRRRGDEA